MDAGGFQAQSDDAVDYETDDRVSLVSSASAELQPVATTGQNLLPSWQKLARNAAEPNVYYEHLLLNPALKHFSTHPDLSLFLFWAGVPHKSDLLGLLPIGPSRQFGRWPVPFVQNWTHHNSFLGTPLVRSGFENQFWTALFRELDIKNWPGFLHIRGLTVGGPLDQALRSVCVRQQRRCDLVHSEARAWLHSNLDADSYYTETIRSKKRKELRRQAKRLAELGEIKFSHQMDDAGLDGWTDDFLKLERQSWKGREGSALDCSQDTRAFFSETLAGAASSGQLERHDLRLDGKPLAMLVNFRSAPGSFSFKTAFDQAYARFSPGVLLQVENLKILDQRDIDWMDSCATEGHPMIDSLWSGRRHIGRFSIELKGLSRGAMFRGVRLGEDLMAHIKKREIIDIAQAHK
ncbi:GNAT family N-acetyltransferase [Parasphingorhabdus cellanae]|uniref:GNAT family N-acetyltransferase n=1 Tax=Parasphingorhabdus cellanae TaxID=2806553 RepID=A0ABX7T4P9_9SPHN|nr:GNAT family N-acetyltransferase [Parasphingorhabdus cellanae]QTD55517.1 GNAT family N-acetyltransferase [Parasphingorhabdus cellanae]